EQRARCHHLVLDFLDPAAVAAYVTWRWPALAGDGALAAWLHGRSDGNPLFLRLLADHLESGAWVDPRGGTWRMPATADHVPASLSELILAQVAQAAAPDRELLEAASASGADFCAAEVAAALAADADEIEAR